MGPRAVTTAPPRDKKSTVASTRAKNWTETLCLVSPGKLISHRKWWNISDIAVSR